MKGRRTLKQPGPPIAEEEAPSKGAQEEALSSPRLKRRPAPPAFNRQGMLARKVLGLDGG